MRVGKAKRRFMRWERWSIAIGTFRIFPGHAQAHADLLYANRPRPLGVRAPWLLLRDYAGMTYRARVRGR